MILIKRLERYFEKHPSEFEAVIWILKACFWFSLMASLIRFLSKDIPPFEMVFLRNSFCVLIMLPWILRSGIKKISPDKWNLYIYRALSGVIGMFLFFYSLSILPLTQSVALTFTVPLFSTLLAILFLGEKVDIHRWCALIIGFIGVLVILRPGMDVFQPASLLMIVTSITWSVSNILAKKLTFTEPSEIIVFMMMLVMTPIAAPVAFMTWKTPDLHSWLWIIILAWITVNAQISLTKAFSKADVSVVLPFDFSRLILITIMAYIFFGEIIDAWTAIGSVIIFASSVYIVRRRKNVKP